MPSDQAYVFAYVFGPFRLELGAGVLRRDGEEVALTPKAFALLRCLVERAGLLVSREELLEAVWPATFVGDEALKVRIHELRRALEDAGSKRLIATVHRRGYRFVGDVNVEAATGAAGRPPAGAVVAAPPPQAASSFPGAGGAPAPSIPPAGTVVGREAELARLAACLGRALAGERQAVFVSGEPGIGKSTLVDAFLAGPAAAGLCLARGQCLELHGAGESYLPVLDALARAGRGPAGEELAAALRALAPAWLALLPGLIAPGEREATTRDRVPGAGREGMLRELAAAIEALAATTPVVLVLEDLHWCDASTADLLSYLARRREPARLLLLATYRPDEVAAAGSHPIAPLPHDLASRGLAVELPLGALDERQVAEYLVARLGGPAPAGLARRLHRHTEGSPLFLVSAAEDLLARGRLRREDGGWRIAGDPAELAPGVPAGLRALLELQLDRLGAEERRLLEAASVAGARFTPVAIAAALATDLEEVEERCASLARTRRFLRARPADEEGGYGFLHALYRDAVYERVPPSRRARLHARFAEHLERAYGAEAGAHAAELAVHFERAGERERALPWLLQAARNATRRFASDETLLHGGRALRLLDEGVRPAGGAAAARDLELELQVLRGEALRTMRGYGDPEGLAAFERARALCADSGAGAELFPVLVGLFGYHLIRAELPVAWELAQDLLRRAAASPSLLPQAHWCAGVTLLNRGEYVVAHEHLAAGLEVAARETDRGPALPGTDGFVLCASFDAWALCGIGSPDEALRLAARAVGRARSLGDPHALAFGLFFTAFVHHFRREPGEVRTAADELVAIAREESLAQWLAFGTILRGWAMTEQGEVETGVDEIRRGLDAYRATGARVSVPHFLGLLAEALARNGEREAARAAVDEALAEAAATGGRYYEAELLRLRADLAGEVQTAGARRTPRDR